MAPALRLGSWAEDQRFELLDVTSPEEDYTDVNNEIYTNVVAHESLMAAVQAAQLLGVQPDAKGVRGGGRRAIPAHAKRQRNLF